ncbi:MAG TPA: hypothetical protein VIF40_12900 [Methylosinus sp.]
MLSSLDSGGGLTAGDGVIESLDIQPCHGPDLQTPDLRLNVPLDAALVGRQSRRLFRLASPQDFARLCIGEVEVRQLGDGRGLAALLPVRRRIAARNDFPEQPSRLGSGKIGRPWRAVPADRMPALAPVLCAIFQDVGWPILLAPGAETRNGPPALVPYRRAGLQDGNVFERDHERPVL